MVGKVHKTTELQRFFSQNQNQKEKHFQNSLLDEIVISWWREEKSYLILFQGYVWQDPAQNDSLYFCNFCTILKFVYWLLSFQCRPTKAAPVRWTSAEVWHGSPRGIVKSVRQLPTSSTLARWLRYVPKFFNRVWVRHKRTNVHRNYQFATNPV